MREVGGSNPSCPLFYFSIEKKKLTSFFFSTKFYVTLFFIIKKRVTDVGFEPTHPKILVPKTSALDHSANQSRYTMRKTSFTNSCSAVSENFFVVFFLFVFVLFKKILVKIKKVHLLRIELRTFRV